VLVCVGVRGGKEESSYLHAKDVAVVSTRWVGDEVGYAFSAVCSEFLEESLRLGLCEWAHCVCGYVRW
jgi:hypothetical protein